MTTSDGRAAAQRTESTWQVVAKWDPFSRVRDTEVLGEYETRKEAVAARAAYIKENAPIRGREIVERAVYVREHLPPLSLDAYMDRGGR